MSEPGRFEEIAPEAGALPIPAKEISRLAHCGPDARWDEEIAAGISEARAIISPRARFTELALGDLDGLFTGGTPVEAIARDGARWIFVATIGSALESRVRRHFDSGEFLAAVLLDAAGSAAVESLGDAVEAACAPGATSARFSPGYCGWSLENQRRIFDRLQPHEIDVRLLPSLLMEPLKSISGLVVRAPFEALLVPAEACSSCDANGCTRRRVL